MTLQFQISTITLCDIIQKTKKDKQMKRNKVKYENYLFR